jgi:autotransporter-associated beta strand protein
VGGFGGGNGGQGFSTTCGGGGGGAGLGGAIFVNAGVVLTIQDTFSTGSGGNANSVVGGPRGFGQFDGQLGQGIGSDAFFATGSTITLDPNGSTITYNGTIGDDSPSSLGTVLNIGNVLSAPGTVTFNGANTYGGGTILNTGTLAVGSTNALGTGTLTFASLDGNILQAAASGVTLPSAIALSKHGTVDTNGFSMELSGVINGSSTLTKTGAGTLTLSASNLYSGGTHFNNGTIAVGNNNAFGPGVVTFDVNDNNTLQAAVDGLSISNLITLSKNGVVDTNNFSLTLAGDITGPGSLNKIGAGQLRLSGAHDFIGGTTVSAGMLTIDGSLSSNIDVLPGSILNGSGLVTGDLTIGGTLGPGNMIGTFEVIGNVTFQTGSAFQVEADPSRADILDVDASGNITIQPGSTITIFPTIATYGANTTYLIATAGESGGIVIGTFDNVTNSFPLIEAQILYTKSSSPSPSLKTLLAGPNQILMILNFVPFSSVVTSGNAGALANSLNGFTPVPGSDMSFVMQQLYFLPTAQALEDALNQMQPSILNSFSMAQQNSSLFVVSALNKHTTDTRQTRSPCTDAGDRKWQVWGDGSVDWARQREDRQNVGFHAKTNLGAGGVDYRVSKQFYLGVLGAYTHTSVDCHHRLSKGRINTYYTGLYSSWISPFSFIDLSVIGNFSDYHSKRVVQFGEIDRRPQGHHRGTGVTAHLDTGISLPKERKAQCYPYGQFDYVYQHEKGYTETKAQSLNNNIRSRNLSMLRSELGVQGKYCYAVGDGVLVPSAKLGWVREARIHGKKINARLVEVPNRYTVEGLYPQRSMVAVGASLMGIFFNQTAHLSLAYEGLFGSGYASNAGNIALNLQF